MTQDDPNDAKPTPLTPPPTVSKLEEEIAQKDAEAERDLGLMEAQEKSKQLRPLFANRIYVEPFGRNLRISFGERIGGEQVFHTAIVMGFEDALEAGELLTRISAANLTAIWDQVRQALEAERIASQESNG